MKKLFLSIVLSALFFGCWAQVGNTFPGIDTIHQKIMPSLTDSSSYLACTRWIKQQLLLHQGDSTYWYYPFHTNPKGYLTGNQSITFSGDATGSGTTSVGLTLATVNSNTGTWGSANQVPTFTVNAKGLVTSVSNTSIAFPITTVFGRSGIVTAQSGDYTYGQVTGAAGLSAANTFSGNNTFSGTNTFSASNTFNTLQLFAGGIYSNGGSFLTGNNSMAMAHNTIFYMQKIQEPSTSYTISGINMDGTNTMLLYGGAARLDSSGNFGANKFSASSLANSNSSAFLQADGGGNFRNIDIGSSLKIDTVNSIAALQNYSNHSIKQIVVSDSLRGGLFRYQITSSLPDSGIVFSATGIGSGYWVRYYENSKGVSPEWFGAIRNNANFNNGPIFNTIFYHGYAINLGKGTYHTKTTINTFTASVLMTGLGIDSSIISVDTNLNGIIVPYGKTFPSLRRFTLISTAPDSTVIGLTSNQPFCDYEDLAIRHFNHIDMLITSVNGIADFGVVKNCFFTFAQSGYVQTGGVDANNFHLSALVAEDCETGFKNNGSGSIIEECSCEACDTSFYDGGQGNTYIHPYIELPLYNPSPIMYINSSNGRILFAAQWGFLFPKFALLADESGWDIQGYNYYQNFTDYQNESAGAVAQIQYNSAGSGWAFQSPAHTGTSSPLSFNLTGTGASSAFNLYTASFSALGSNPVTNGWYIVNGKNFQANVSNTGSGGSFGFQGTAPIGSVGWTSGLGNPNSNSLPFAAGSMYSQADNTDSYPFWVKSSTTSFNTGWQRVLTTGPGTYVNPVDTSMAFYKLKIWPSTKPASAGDSTFVYESADSSLRKVPTTPLSSGAYVPTLTVGSNCSGLTSDSCFYTRIGNIVTVHGHLSLTVTSSGSTGSVVISLPINSNTFSHSGWGTSSNINASSIGSFLQAGPSANQMQLYFQTTASSVLENYYFNFSYIVQ